MDQFTRKNFTTSRSLSYTYYVSPQPSPQSPNPTLLLLHGFPDDAQEWATVVPFLIPLGFPILIPDLLGYAGSSKPTDPTLYNSRSMSDDLVEILDSESIQHVIPIGHDWGSILAQRLYLFHSSRVVGLGLVSVPYYPPSQPFEFEAINKMTEQLLGYPQFAYWELFTAPDGPQILNDHIESFYTVLHGNPSADWMKQMFCAYGALRSYLLADKTVSLHQYAQNPAFRDAFITRFRRDGFEGPLQWYVAAKDNWEVEKDIQPQTLKIDLPVLYISSTGDAVCPGSGINPTRDAGLLPNLTIREIDCGHWCPYEKPNEVGEIIADFLKDKGFLQQTESPTAP